MTAVNEPDNIPGERKERKAAARVYYETNPGATLPQIAEQFDIPYGSVKRWSSEEKWSKNEVRVMSGLPKRAMAMVKRAVQYNGGDLDNEELRALAMLAHHKERNKVASKLSRDLRLVQSRLALLIGQSGPAVADEVRKLALIADAQKKVSAELRSLWRLDDGIVPMINDGISEAEDAAKVKRLQAELPSGSSLDSAS